VFYVFVASGLKDKPTEIVSERTAGSVETGPPSFGVRWKI